MDWQSKYLNKIVCGDSLELLKELQDNSIDLILTDPPYGIGADKAQNSAALQRIKADGKSKAGRGWKLYDNTDWDSVRPTKDYFDELRRISKNQIIWGGNYFSDWLPPSSGWIVWNKCQREFSLADGELAWTSFNIKLKIFDYSRGAALQDGRVHPTQKPLALGKWILENYGNNINIILDPFCGSGTFLLSAKSLNYQFIGIDISEKYCEISRKRLANTQMGFDI